MTEIEQFKRKQNEFYFEPSQLLPEDKNSFGYETSYESIPVIVLFGWAGANDNHLKKYSQFYNSLGYHTIRFSPSNAFTFYHLNQHKKLTYKFLNLLKESLNLTKNKLLFHFFSNACVFAIYRHIINAIRSNYEYGFISKNQVGVIFDSGPGKITGFFKLISGIHDILKTEVKVKSVRFLIAAVLASTFTSYFYLKFDNEHVSDSIRVVLSDDRELPVLVLYSKNDKLVSAEKIEEFVDKKQKLQPENVNIRSYNFENADHAMIYLKYPREYVQHIKEHLKICKIELKNSYPSLELPLIKSNL